MSKTFRAFLPVLVSTLVLLSAGQSKAQDVEVKLSRGVASENSVFIQLRLLSKSPERRGFAFRTGFAGKTLAANRISELKIYDGDSQKVPYRSLGPGEYLAEADFVSMSYLVNLTTPNDLGLRTHISWISGKSGVLMLDDLLPVFTGRHFPQSARVRFETPPTGPSTFSLALSTEQRREDASFLVTAIPESVFYVGPDWNRGFELLPHPSWSKVISLGESPDHRSEADGFTQEIGRRYFDTFAVWPPLAVVAIVNVPGPHQEWAADTRGSSITILTSDPPFPSQALQKRHEQLRHEMFHLWIPNDVNLTGNYDWFYEGFALYQSLKMGVELNRIRFDDYLDTLSRTIDIDRRQAQKQSLINVSKNRWSGDNNTVVYARGMLVAFLCDLALLEKSKGERAVSYLLRRIYLKHRPPTAETDGNTAVLSEFRSYPELAPIIDRYINGVEMIELNGLLRSAGLEAKTENDRTRLTVTAKPSGRQKNLLDKLGYNNWRKLSKGN